MKYLYANNEADVLYKVKSELFIKFKNVFNWDMILLYSLKALIV